ncbi:hypothetical protein CHG34_004596 [Salmonella enterica subsp. enterica serovar Enteritidis]|nr:hypothetical protein [Salmonella enterica subsp. enterica serovar Enteritidis]
MMHTSSEHRRVSCGGVLILGCQEPDAQQASNCVGWCSCLLKMTISRCPANGRLSDLLYDSPMTIIWIAQSKQ